MQTWLKNTLMVSISVVALSTGIYGGYRFGYNNGKDAGSREARPTELTGARIDSYKGRANYIYLPNRDSPSYRLHEESGEITGLSKIVEQEVPIFPKPAIETATTITKP